MKRLAATAALLLAFAGPAPARAADEPLLRQGDRVVLFGDSITEQKLYTRYLQQYVYCRHPELDVRFFNAGWGGDTVTGAMGRYERDVLPLAPTVVTLFFGMNDGGYRKKDDAVVTVFKSNLTDLVKALKGKGIRVVVFGPGATDASKGQRVPPEYDGMLEALSQTSSEVAKQQGCVFGDIFHPMRDFLAARRKSDPGNAIVPDGVHPDAEGHLVIARAMLKALRVDAMPAFGEMDVKSGKGKGLKLDLSTPERVVLTTSGAVTTPFWFPPQYLRTMRETGLLDDLAGQRLTVENLPRGTWDVDIDDADAGSFTAAELAKGVTLAGFVFPRSKAVPDLITRKEASYAEAWRTVRLGMTDFSSAGKLYAALMTFDEGLHGTIRAQAEEQRTYLINLTPSPTGTNVALHAKYESSDPNTNNFGAGGLTDGSWDADQAHCFATGSSDRFPKFVTIDLGAAAKIAAVRLGVPEFGSTRNVKISVSGDGTAFTDVGAVEFGQRQRAKKTVSFATVKARWVRLTYVDRWQPQVQFPSAFSFTTECEVYEGK